MICTAQQIQKEKQSKTIENMNLKKSLVSLLAVASLVFFMASCGGGSGSGKDEVTILYPNWAEGVAFTYLAKVALEDNGYDVDLINLEPGLIYGELSKDNPKETFWTRGSPTRTWITGTIMAISW